MNRTELIAFVQNTRRYLRGQMNNDEQYRYALNIGQGLMMLSQRFGVVFARRLADTLNARAKQYLTEQFVHLATRPRHCECGNCATRTVSGEMRWN